MISLLISCLNLTTSSGPWQGGARSPEHQHAQRAGHQHKRRGRVKGHGVPEVVEDEPAPQRADDSRQAGQRLRHAQRASLVGRIGKARHHRQHRRAVEAHAHCQQANGRHHQRHAGGYGDAGQRNRHYEDRRRHHPVFADTRHDAPHDDPLNQRQHHADPREEIPDRGGAKVESRLDEEREHRLEGRKGGHHQERHRQHEHQLRMRPGALECFQAARSQMGAAFVGRQRLWQEEQRRAEVRQRQRGGEERRRRVSPVAEETADGRPEDEAEAKGRAHQPHAPGPVLGRGGVRDERLRGRDVRAGNPGQDARGKQHRQ